jgi:hypothetical protein
VVQVPSGTPLVYRVGQGWGNQPHLPTLEGHRFYQEPGMAGSEQYATDVLVPGMTLNLHFVGGAGGDIQAEGDYLFLDRRQPFLEGGMWDLLRVTNEGNAFASDPVAVTDLRTTRTDGGVSLALLGRVGIRPAGDFVSAVTVYDGQVVNGRCQGRILGRSAVAPDTGRFRLERTVPAMPGRICIQSPAGGVLSEETAALTAVRLR